MQHLHSVARVRRIPGHPVMNARRSGATPQSAPRVLVVDDELQVRDFVSRVLEIAGYRVTTAENGVAAVAVVSKEGPPDLLLTDLKMPQMDGDELAARLRQATPDLKVLYFTGFSEALFSNRRTLWEGEAFLEKPCSPAGLLEGVSLLLFECLAPTAAGLPPQAASARSLLGGLTKNPPGDVV
jgi:CheY-like chemotaxis protein